MTTYTNFTPPLPFQFQATLDGAAYTVTVVWNITGQRSYINVTDSSGNLVVSTPLIGSPAAYNINLVGGYFTTSTMVFRAATAQFEVAP